MAQRTTLRQWLGLATSYDGPGTKRAAISLWLRDLGDHFADADPGPMRWRWHAADLVRNLRKTHDRLSRRLA
jgi:hypothetical protein